MNLIFESLGYKTSSSSTPSSSFLPSNYKNVTPQWHQVPTAEVPQNTMERKSSAITLNLLENRTVRVPLTNYDAFANMSFNCQVCSENNNFSYIGTQDGVLNKTFVKEADGTEANVPTFDTDTDSYLIEKKFNHGTLSNIPVDIMFTRPTSVTLEVGSAKFDITNDFGTFTTQDPLLLYLLRKLRVPVALVFNFEKTPIKQTKNFNASIVWLQLQADYINYDRDTIVKLNQHKQLTRTFSDGNVLDYFRTNE